MKPIRCLAIDDEPIALEKLSSYISRIPFLELVASCDGPYEAMRILAEDKPDAVFIDINMPDLNGLEFMESLPDRPLVVFTTAYSEFAAESYKVQAVDYILKPYGFADFQMAANKLLRQYSLLSMEESSVPGPVDSIYVKTDYKYVKVDFHNVSYIEGMNEYLRIHFSDGSAPVVTHTTMKKIKEKLPPCFLQVHRSYIVNMDKVKEVERSRLLLDPDVRIPVGDSFKGDFQQFMMIHSIGKGNNVF